MKGKKEREERGVCLISAATKKLQDILERMRTEGKLRNKIWQRMLLN